MAKKFNDNIFNQSLDIQEVDEQIFGTGLDTVAGKRITGKPVDIFELRADVTQPRRTVPLSVRGNWDGTADDVPDLLERWGDAAKAERGKPILPHLVVRGLLEDPIEVDEKTEPISYRFLDLLKLAGSIRREGLLNPIQIYRQGTGGQIVAGERRWLAHHVLNMYDEDVEQWSMIPAVQTDKVDVWIQATENGRRAPLNAISMARQLALLIMDMYKDEAEFASYADTIASGGSDLDFYAQVADGTTYRIKRGMTDQILEVTGLTSRKSVQRYRDLLNLDDETWTIADEEDWTEGACRRILHPEYFEEKEDMSSNEDISPQNTDSSPFGELSPQADDNLQVGQGYSQPYKSTTMDAIPDGRGQIKVGQFRARHVGEHFPYMQVMREYNNGDYDVEIHNIDGSHTTIVSNKSIYQYWTVVLDSEPQRPTTHIVQSKPAPPADTNRTDEAIKQQGEVDLMGYDTPEYPSGDPVQPSGERRPTTYKNDDEWDQPQRRQPATDSMLDVPIIANYDSLRRILNNLQTVCIQIDYKQQHNTLREIMMLTPRKVKSTIEEGGIEEYDTMLTDYAGAVESIVGAIYYELTTYFADVDQIAGVQRDQSDQENT